MRNLVLLFVIAGVFTLPACNKEEIVQADCQRLQHGIIASDKEEVKAVITKFINNLSSQAYSQPNMNDLVTSINR